MSKNSPVPRGIFLKASAYFFLLSDTNFKVLNDTFHVNEYRISQVTPSPKLNITLCCLIHVLMESMLSPPYSDQFFFFFLVVKLKPVYA